MDLSNFWPFLPNYAYCTWKNGLKIAEISTIFAEIPRETGVFSDPFHWSRCAHFSVHFSELHIRPLIQASRKVENVNGILIHPIWGHPQNWCYGWGFWTLSSRSWDMGRKKCPISSPSQIPTNTGDMESRLYGPEISIFPLCFTGVLDQNVTKLSIFDHFWSRNVTKLTISRF